jgi:hypothetical protein
VRAGTTLCSWWLAGARTNPQPLAAAVVPERQRLHWQPLAGAPASTLLP